MRAMLMRRRIPMMRRRSLLVGLVFVVLAALVVRRLAA
jgi:hypothetical protein